jgi:hypothetical protein
MTKPIDEERPDTAETNLGADGSSSDSGGDVEVGPTGGSSTDSGGDVEVTPDQPA